MTSQKRKRYVVSDLGFAYGVHDTQAPAAYSFEAGKDKAHPSNNELNTVRIDICATRVRAQQIVDRLNAEFARMGA
ncbi:MAG: hypothetical protein ACI8QS_001763 [Planctomycetota bacterium]|jgi:hypothetical protein